MSYDKHCRACTFGREGGGFCSRHATARERRLEHFLLTGVIRFPRRRYRIDLVYGDGWGEEFLPWTDEDGLQHEPMVQRLTLTTTLVEFAGEETPFILYGDSQGARADVSSAEQSAKRSLEWAFERREGVLFSLVSNWIDSTEIPTRDPAVWGVEFRGYGPWGMSSIGRTAYLTTPGAEFLEHDLMDIVGVAGHDEWNAGLGDIEKNASYWKTSVVVNDAAAHVVPIKQPTLGAIE
jgi:hypothetical protein